MAEYKLSYTGEEIDEKLSMVGQRTGVTAGTYGGYKSSYYDIPNITVDDYGRITSVFGSTLTTVTSKSNGLMPYTAYNFLSSGNTVSSYFKSITASTEFTNITVYPVPYITHVLLDNTVLYVPKIISVYVYAYIDESKSSKMWIPANYLLGDASMNSALIKVKIPSEYYNYNVDESMPCMVLYGGSLSTSSTTM